MDGVFIASFFDELQKLASATVDRGLARKSERVSTGVRGAINSLLGRKTKLLPSKAEYNWQSMPRSAKKLLGGTKHDPRRKMKMVSTK